MPNEDRHTEEISYIAYAGDDCNLVTCSWDKSIKIFKDGAVIEMLRQKQNAHQASIITADYSHNLSLIVTGGRDNRVRIWDYEWVKLEYEIYAHTE